jgi:hypothetical protein
MFRKHLVTVALLSAAVAWQPALQAETLASSMGIFIYPAGGQPPEQQSKDDYECFMFAKSQTGYDPMNPTQVVAQTPDKGASGARASGALRGAAAGAIIGEVASNDAGKGAAIGATLGVLGGGSRDRQARANQARQAEQAAQQQTAAIENSFRNAYGACIEARGYSAKY